MTIQVGDTLPAVNLITMTDEGPKPMAINELCSGKKVVFFAVPGAFTPTCSVQHLPGFIENSLALKDKGVDMVACISVNDPFVMNAWGKENYVEGKILMIGDPFLYFTKAIGADVDKSGRGLGIRSNRYLSLIHI